MSKILFFLLAALSLFAKEKTDVLFYLQDAGETKALLPVIDSLEKRGIHTLILVAGVAEESLMKRENLRTFEDLGLEVQMDRTWPRSKRLSEGDVSLVVEEIEASKVVTGVAFVTQGQVLEAYRKRGIPSFAYWDNFNPEGENPYFEVARSVSSQASQVLAPTSYHTGMTIVGHPTLEVWRKEMEAIDREQVRARLQIVKGQKAILWIGGYGEEYEKAYQIFLEGIALVPDVYFWVQPHPKTGEGTKTTLVEAMAAADLILCHQSTAAFQALSMGKPVIHVIPAGEVFDSLSLQTGLAKKVSNGTELVEALREIREISPEEFYELLGIPVNSIERCTHVILGDSNVQSFP